MKLRSLLPAVLLPVLAGLCLLHGGAAVPATDVGAALLGGGSELAQFVVWQTRLPAVCAAVLCGASLGVGGLLLQTLFGNPLADPSLLGVNGGAGLGVAVAVLLLGGTLSAGSWSVSGYALSVGLAFAGAMGVIALLLGLAAVLPGRLSLLVSGVMVGFVATALISLLTFFATAQGVQTMFLWGMGSFGGVTWNQLPLFGALCAFGLCATMVFGGRLNALLLGETYARNLGVDVRAMRRWLLALAGLLCAAVTSLCGPISFVGLAVPHAARLLLRTADHRRLLPVVMLLGADVCLLCHALCQLPGGSVLPLNVVTPLLGVPIVFYLLVKR